MTGKQAFIGEPAAFLVEWMRETERAATDELNALERQLRTELKQSDERLIRQIQKEVGARVQAVEDALRERLAEAQKAEQQAREALEKAQQTAAETERRLQQSIGVNLVGQPGPAAAGRPLGELLRGRFTRVVRFRDDPPAEAWYVVNGMAFGMDFGGTRLRPPLSPEEADAYADRVVAVVVGVVDETLDCLAVAHSCSLYGSVERARAVAETHKAYVKTWLTPVTRVVATQYCHHTWAGEAGEGTTLEDWLRSTRSFTLVPRKNRTWVLDMNRGVDIASWTDRSEETFQQLVAAGIDVQRGRRRRGDDDEDAHGDGFHLPSEILPTIPIRTAVVTETPDRGAAGRSRGGAGERAS